MDYHIESYGTWGKMHFISINVHTGSYDYLTLPVDKIDQNNQGMVLLAVRVLVEEN